MYAKSSRYFKLLMIALISFSCATLRSINVFPEGKDVELGLQIEQEIKKNPGEYPLLTDRPEIKAYVEGVSKKILASPELRYRETFAYKLEIVKNDSIVNAFCTPGGYIYVYTGLMKFIDNEATLAGVIGHEIAHAERRHATKRMTAALGAEVLVGIVLGEKPSQMAQLGANLFTGLGLLANSRADESEADAYSFRYLRSTEYYPGAIEYFFDKVKGSGTSRGSTLERLLSTHPLPQDRIDGVRKMVVQAGLPAPKEGQLFAQRYQQIRRKLP